MATLEFIKTPQGLAYASDEDREAMKRVGKIGSLIRGKFSAPRNGKFHRKCRVLQEALFDNQEEYTSYKLFRERLKLKTDLFDLLVGLDGKLYPKTRSTAYEDMDEVEHEKWYQKLIDFAVMDGSMFEGKSSAEADRFVDQIIGGFA